MSENTQPVFNIQRIYVKDLSFEAPNTPETFRKDWKPEVKIDLDSKHTELDSETFEVVLHLTATVTLEDSTAFLVEVHQAGIFTLKAFPEEHKEHALGAMCPNILFPYVRETVSDAVTRGGFPQLLLAPINFEAMYMQKKAQAEKAAQ